MLKRKVIRFRVEEALYNKIARRTSNVSLWIRGRINEFFMDTDTSVKLKPCIWQNCGSNFTRLMPDGICPNCRRHQDKKKQAAVRAKSRRRAAASRERAAVAAYKKLNGDV